MGRGKAGPKRNLAMDVLHRPRLAGKIFRDPIETGEPICGDACADATPITVTTAAPVDDPRLRFLDRCAGWRSFVARGQVDLAEAIDHVAIDINTSGVFRIVVPEPVPEPKSAAETAWDSKGWREAAVAYHRDRRCR